MNADKLNNKLGGIFKLYAKWGHKSFLFTLICAAWVVWRVSTKPTRIGYPCSQFAIGQIALFYGTASAPALTLLHNCVSYIRNRDYMKVARIVLIAVIVFGCYSIYQDYQDTQLRIRGSGTIPASSLAVSPLWMTSDLNPTGGYAFEYPDTVSPDRAVVSFSHDPLIGYGTSSPPYDAPSNSAYDFVWDTVERLNLGSHENPLDDLINTGDTVLIKPNWVEFGPGVYTRPEVIRPLIDMAYVAGAAQIYVGDGSANVALGEEVMSSGNYTAMGTALAAGGVPVQVVNLNKRDYGWHWVNLSENSSFAGSNITQAQLGTGWELLFEHDYYFATDNYSVNPSGNVTGWYAVNDIVLESDVIINVPKLKTHQEMIATGSIKNLVGFTLCSTFDDLWYGQRIPHHHYPREDNYFLNDIFWRAILDMNKIVLYTDENGIMQPNQQRKYLNVVDGIQAMERSQHHVYGDGIPYDRHVVLAGVDPVAVDAVGTRVMGYDYREIASIANAASDIIHPIGTNNPENIVIIGDSIGSEIDHVFLFCEDWIDDASLLGLNDFTPPNIITVERFDNTIDATITGGIAAYVVYESGGTNYIEKMDKSGDDYTANIPDDFNDFQVIAQDEYFNTVRTDVPVCALTMTASGGGNVIPSEGPHVYTEGSVVDITATPTLGWQFDSWTGDVSTVADVNSASTNITMNGDYTITANFNLPNLTLTMAVGGNGTVTPTAGDHACLFGEVVEITAVPALGWEFVNWTGDVANAGSTLTTVTMDTDKTVTANFGPQNDIPICTTPSNQLYCQIASDGAGGAIITWRDHRINGQDIYAQRVNSSGDTVWTDNGTAVCTADNDQRRPQIVSDDTGGAIITWSDERGDVYAQRIDSSGNCVWTDNGKSVCTAVGSQGGTRIVADGSGGAILTWTDLRTDTDVYAQRIDASGNALWTNDGVVISTAVDSQSSSQIASDGSGGAVIAWRDLRHGQWDIFTQRIDGSGNTVWTDNGTAVCTVPDIQWNAQIVSDGAGGAIIAWEDERNGYFDIYAQRIDSAGNTLWTDNGTAICTEIYPQEFPELTTDGSGGAIITWHDQRSGYFDIYAQRIDSSGNTLWTDNGTAICTVTGNQREPDIISDGVGGAVITWHDSRNGNSDIYAQRIDGDGNTQWTDNGTAICTAFYNQMMPKLTTDGSGGAVITWADEGTGSYDIYAQKVDSTGSFDHDQVLMMLVSGSGNTTPSIGGHSYSWGETVDITAVPAPGWQFVNWTGDVGTVADVNSASTNITMNGDYSITANFMSNNVTLTMAVDGCGTVVPSAGQHSFLRGSIVSINATPSYGWEFKHWIGDVDDIYLASTNVTMDSGKVVTACFSLAPTAEMIVFTSFRDGNYEIYRMNTDGACQTRLTENTFTDYWPDLSPDSSRIAYVSYESGHTEIYVMNSDGSGRTRLTFDSAYAVHPAWSPDGSKIAFSSSRDGGNHIFTMNADGSDLTRLTFTSDYNNMPCWSPDGSKIAFCSMAEVQPNVFTSTVFIMNVDGSGRIRLTYGGPAALVPAWSPDGGKIAFESYGTTPEIEVIGIDGSNRVTLGTGAYPSWSPDGTRIVFNDGPGNDDIFIMNADGSNRVRLTDNPEEDWDPSISRWFINPNLLKISASGNGTTTPPCGSHWHETGTLVDITAVPDPDWEFVNWTGDVGTVADVNSASTNITMNGDYTVTANFIHPVITCTRDLPVNVAPGTTFTVTVSFTSPADTFNSIVLHDQAPAGWPVSVNKTGCTPPAMTEKIIGIEDLEYTWLGPYNQDTTFTAVYEVTVPGGTPEGTYNLPDGWLVYYIGQDEYQVAVTFESEIHVTKWSISGIAREANCDVLPGATVNIYLNSIFQTGTTSDINGEYELAVSGPGTYTVTISKAGYRDETQLIEIIEQQLMYELKFTGDRSIIADEITGTYFAACMNKYLYGTGDCAFGGVKFAGIMNAYLYGIP